MTDLVINEETTQTNCEGDTPLLWVIRDDLKLTGTKYGCGKGLCGACTVHLDDQAVRSCLTPLTMAKDKKITTIEHVDQQHAGKAVIAAWRELDVVQCGYCQSGQIMAATMLLKQNANPSDEEIDAAMSGNICRCATYQRIKNAIKQASIVVRTGVVAWR